MIKKKKSHFGFILTLLFTLITTVVFPQNIENNTISEQDTTELESAEIITIGSTGNENPVVQQPDTIAAEETIPDTIAADTQEEPVTENTNNIDYTTPQLDPAELAKAKQLLKQYYFPPVEIEFEYPDTIILPSLQLPFVYCRDRTPDTTYLPEISTSPGFIPFEKRLPVNRFFSDQNSLNTIDRSAYLYIVDNHPEYVKYSTSDLSGRVEKAKKIEANDLNNIFKMDYDLSRDFINNTEKYQPRKKYWIWKGTHYISFSQSDNSTNWTDTTRTKGEKGMGAINLVSVQGITGKYKKNRIEINHNMEWRLSIANSMNDSLRSIKIIEDRLRSYTDFGITAIKHWNYSTTLEMTTPLLTNHRENTLDTISAFLSPVKITYGLGMQYQITKEYPATLGKKIVFVAYINPLALQYIYIKSHVLDPSQHGIKEPKGNKNLSLLDFGSTITSTIKLNFNKYVTLDSRLKYFTNYHKTYLESENTLNMPVNRYISMRLYFYFTFDDMRLRNKQFGHFNINETLGLTFNVTW